MLESIWYKYYNFKQYIVEYVSHGTSNFYITKNDQLQYSFQIETQNDNYIISCHYLTPKSFLINKSLSMAYDTINMSILRKLHLGFDLSFVGYYS